MLINTIFLDGPLCNFPCIDIITSFDALKVTHCAYFQLHIFPCCSSSGHALFETNTFCDLWVLDFCFNFISFVVILTFSSSWIFEFWLLSGFHCFSSFDSRVCEFLGSCFDFFLILLYFSSSPDFILILPSSSFIYMLCFLCIPDFVFIGYHSCLVVRCLRLLPVFLWNLVFCGV